MALGSYRFDRFLLDPADRQLTRDDVPVDINARYLDALALLVAEAGRMVSKDRFLDEVWRGVPVTDEALTQCIRTLRQKLGDDAARPRFIETVPKHGYRFVAPVEDGGTPRRAAPGIGFDWRRLVILGGAGTLGGMLAGLIGGLFYGFAGASLPLAPGMGATSVLTVLLAVTLAAALMGGAGVGFGIAAAGMAWPGPVAIVGGALGGMVVGGVVKLLGLDAFNLLLGQSPGDITGGGEGLLLGAAVGAAAWLAGRGPTPMSPRRSAALAAAAGAAGGLLIVLLGGRLMGGSLDLIARNLPDSRLRLDQIGALLGENGFGLVSQRVTGALEGALFAACLVGAMTFARRQLDR